MIFSWFRNRRRRKLLAQPFPAAWTAMLEELPFYAALEAGERAVLRDVTRVLVAEKDWEGCGGLEITDKIRVVVAAQAALLVLNIPHAYYRNATTILVYPSAFRSPVFVHQGAGVMGRGDGNLGEAWSLTGPVVLAWDAAEDGARDPRDGRNLVYHEFAHKLDLLDGHADGRPPLEDRDGYVAWQSIMAKEFETLRRASDSGRATLLDKYGATNPAEFFAVATECFFERPQKMQERHAALYGLLQSYYKQDPAARPGG